MAHEAIIFEFSKIISDKHSHTNQSFITKITTSQRRLRVNPIQFLFD